MLSELATFIVLQQTPDILLCLASKDDGIFISSRLIVMRMHNIHETDKDKDENESSDEESDEDEEDEDKKPQLELAMMPHYGGINRVRVSLVTFIFTLINVFIILEN